MAMTLLKRHVWRSVLLPIIALLSIIVAVDGLFSFLAELESLRGDYQSLQALQYVLTTVPRKIHDFLPLAILLGALVGLSLLANAGELVVIRAAGISTMAVSWLVLRPVLVLLVLSAPLGEWVVPHTEQLAQSNRAIAEGGGEALRSRYGFWHREGDEFIHINAVQPAGVLFGVTRYRYNGQELQEAVFAEQAHYKGGYWQLSAVRGTRFYPDRVENFQADTQRWDNSVKPDLISTAALSPDNMAAAKLWEYSRYMQRQGLNAGEYLLSFWQRLFMPMATIGMVLIAITFVFGSMRSVSMGVRLTAGIVAGLLFHYGQQFTGQLSLVFNANPLIAGIVPPLITVLLGIYLLRRVR